jgi:hypothetical protein
MAFVLQSANKTLSEMKFQHSGGYFVKNDPSFWENLRFAKNTANI